MEFLNIALTFAMDDIHVLIKKTKELTKDKGEGKGGVISNGRASPR